MPKSIENGLYTTQTPNLTPSQSRILHILRRNRICGVTLQDLSEQAEVKNAETAKVHIHKLRTLGYVIHSQRHLNPTAKRKSVFQGYFLVSEPPSDDPHTPIVQSKEITQ